MRVEYNRTRWRLTERRRGAVPMPKQKSTWPVNVGIFKLV
jgi:hypothetical protein